MRKLILYIFVWIFWISLIWWDVYAECRTEEYDCVKRFGDISCKTRTVCDKDNEWWVWDKDNEWWVWDCPEWDISCLKARYYESDEYKNNSCWELSAWQYCCEGLVTNVPCDSVVVTPDKDKCNWIKLNTNFPIIWNCIWDDAGEDATKAFPSMIWAFTKIVMALILVGCFIIIIYAGILWAADKPKEAKEWLKRVAITILLLWFSGAILKLINPNFFTS